MNLNTNQKKNPPKIVLKENLFICRSTFPFITVFLKGSKLYMHLGPTYGTTNVNSIAVTRNGKLPFFEIPLKSVTFE